MALGDQQRIAGGGSTGHPSLEMLAAYSDRKLSAAENATVERHAATCRECRQTLIDTAAFLELEHQPEEVERTAWPGRAPPQRLRKLAGPVLARPVLAGLAAAAVLLLTVQILRPDREAALVVERTSLAPLIEASTAERTRFTDGRLTGGFPYAAAPSFTRGATEEPRSPEVRIAAAEIEKRIGTAESAEDLAALGTALVAGADWDRAVATLERAAMLAPGDARVQSDLAAAYLGRARNGNADYASAVAAAERAIALPDPPIEAFFNRAIAFERIGERDRAMQAWQDYLARDMSSPWAAEARERVGVLASNSSSETVKQP